MDMQTYIDTVIRPKIQGDGGEITYVSESENTVTVLFQGECSKCLILDRCVAWIESEIRRELGRCVKLSVTRKKPFFWDHA